MSLIRRSDFSSLLENFFERDIMNFEDFSQRRNNMPAVNIKENEHEFQIDVAAPGMKKEDFKLDLDNNVLTISSEKVLKNEEKDEQGNYTRRELSYQSFTRSFSLPKMIDTEQIKDNYNDGILRISLLKKPGSEIPEA